MSGSKIGLSAPRRRTPQSELAKAVRMMGAAAGQDAAKGLFGQSVTVSIGATTLSSEAGYDIHFEIPFDSDTEVNESIVTIFNLSVSTLARLQVGSPVKITAGYKRDSVGEVLSGKIKAVRSYWDGLDYVTEHSHRLQRCGRSGATGHCLWCKHLCDCDFTRPNHSARDSRRGFSARAGLCFCLAD